MKNSRVGIQCLVDISSYFEIVFMKSSDLLK